MARPRAGPPHPPRGRSQRVRARGSCARPCDRAAATTPAPRTARWALHDFTRGYPFDAERERYLIHITTGTHVAQICLFLLTETRFFPARLLQTGPPRHPSRDPSCEIIDLDLSRYDSIAQRFEEERRSRAGFLKSGIATRNESFNLLMAQVEKVASSSRAPILLSGPTGAGKTRLARRIHALKQTRGLASKSFAEVNCATLRGDQAMSTLFGHRRGAFTGAVAVADPAALWRNNFRDLSAALTRMSTLAPGGRIGEDDVAAEVARLEASWAPASARVADERLSRLLSEQAIAELDDLDRHQLMWVLDVCAESVSLSAAGRQLFAKSRAKKKTPNDADRVRKYLMRFGVDPKRALG